MELQIAIHPDALKTDRTYCFYVEAVERITQDPNLEIFHFQVITANYSNASILQAIATVTDKQLCIYSKNVMSNEDEF